MLSVITVCFNCANTISRAIESLLNQTDSNFEHIVIDGKSSDDTISIIESYRTVYERRGIKLTVISEHDNGMYDALNKGIRICQDGLIGILNSDDTYETNTIERINAYEKMYPDASIIMGASKTINGKTQLIRTVKLQRFITSRNFNHGSMFVQKSCYDAIGGYADDGNYYDDFMWYIKALKSGQKVKIVDDVLYDFYCGGMSTKKSLSEVFVRIKYRYCAYRNNGCSRLYIFECIAMEFAKWIIVKG